MSLIRSVSGVRGVVGIDLTAELARRYGRAFGRTVRGDVAVGWDSRRNGAELVEAVAAGLRESGSRAAHLGIVPTPTVGIAIRKHRLAGGVAVTASHNPEEYNGLKFFSSEGMFLDGREGRELYELADADPPPEEGEGLPPVTLDGAIDDHIGLVLASDAVAVDAVRAARPKVVVDCVNAAGSVILPRLLRELGCETHELSTDVLQPFPRGAEPTPEHLTDLGREVVERGAAAGLACDPDADRLALVDENGRAVGEEYTLAVAARIVLSGKKGPVVANVSTSRMIEDLAGEAGVPVYRTPVGEINVVGKMVEVSAVVGGEGNGGVILPEVQPGRDAATAAALVASALATSETGVLSELVARFPAYAMVKRKVTLESPSREGIVEVVRGAFPDGDLDLTDGAKMAWTDRWVHVRMSGTEPVVRVIAEARHADVAGALVERAVSALSRQTRGA
jgi:phosphomannomutase